MDYSFLENNKIIPVVVLHDINHTIPTLNALKNGGINIAEITLRTSCAYNSIRLARESFPNMILGAGTVLNKTQCVQAIKAGAMFIVSPGFSKGVGKVCNENNIPYLPGAVTPTEIMTALEEGFDIIKYFPAQSSGGIKALRALSAAFPNVRFVPTGGIDEHNLQDYLSQSFIKAVGGSFMLKGEYTDMEKRTRLAVKAVEEL